MLGRVGRVTVGDEVGLGGGELVVVVVDVGDGAVEDVVDDGLDDVLDGVVGGTVEVVVVVGGELGV